jgi:chlorite dismutase
MNNYTYNFIGSTEGPWKVTKMNTITGMPMEPAPSINIEPFSTVIKPKNMIWSLKGVISNLRYTEKEEKEALTKVQPDLGRKEATYAAMIPIKKTEAWWTMAQDERRKIFEHQSHHTQIGLKYLPAIARKLYHSRDIGEQFDFITWFEFSPQHSDAFDDLLNSLRETEEWKYVEREVDIRLIKQ